MNDTKKLKSYEVVPLLKYVQTVKSGIIKFSGQKKYVDTGSINTGKIIGSDLVTFESRPSRANMEFEESDVIFAKMKGTEKVYLVSKEDTAYLYSTGFCGLRITEKSKILSKYLFFWLRTKGFQRKKDQESTGATQKGLADSSLKKFDLPLPSIETQKKIVSILEKAEKIKEKRKEANELSASYINSLFLKIIQNKINKNVKLGELTSLVSSGSTPLGGSNNYSSTGDILFIRSQNVLMNKFSNHDALYISKSIHDKMRRTWVKKDDVLLNITGASIGRTAIYSGEDDKANVNQHVCILRVADKNTLSPIFLNYYLSSEKFQAHIQKINSGGTREALNFSQIKNSEILLPSIREQQDFAKAAKKVWLLKQKQNETTAHVEQLFNSLMKKAFNGELVV